MELLTEVAEVGRVSTLDEELPDGEAVLPISSIRRRSQLLLLVS